MYADINFVCLSVYSVLFCSYICVGLAFLLLDEALVSGVFCGVFISLFPVTCTVGVYSCPNAMSNKLF
jgi:hypothetical protein